MVLEICKPDDDQAEGEDEAKRVAIAVLSSRYENAKLDLPITSRLGLCIAGNSANGAVVHVVGNQYDVVSDDDEDVDLASGMMGMEVVFDDGEDGDRDMSDDGSSEADADDDESPKKNDESEDKKVVVRKRGLPLIKHRSGLQYQDVIVGSGKKVVRGRNVAIKYTLRLENGKVIDKADSRRPFKFRLGIGECVKGFDIGVGNMREGGERHLIVPPHLGYGQHPPPGIPKNATLYFDVTVIKAF